MSEFYEYSISLLPVFVKHQSLFALKFNKTENIEILFVQFLYKCPKLTWKCSLFRKYRKSSFFKIIPFSLAIFLFRLHILYYPLLSSYFSQWCSLEILDSTWSNLKEWITVISLLLEKGFFLTLISSSALYCRQVDIWNTQWEYIIRVR